MKYNHHRFIIYLLFASSLSLVISKLFYGLDFTDEMQYYGEMMGLIVNDRLFSNDLYVQQIVYAFFYPYFKLYAALSDNYHGFVLYSRIVLFVLLLAVSYLLCRVTKSFERLDHFAALTVLWLYFAGEIFAISYNTIAYMLCFLVVLFWFFTDIKHKFILIALLTAVLFYVYPPAGISIMIIYAFKCFFEGEGRNAVYVIITWGVISCIIFLILIGSGMLHFNDMLVSYKFSSSFGSARLLHSKFDLCVLITIIATFAMCLFVIKNGLPAQLRILIRYAYVRETLLVTSFVVGVLFFVSRYWRLGAIYLFLLLLFVSAMSENHIGYETKKRIIPISTLGILLGIVFSVSSGNGIYKFYAGLLIVLPFLVMLVLSEQRQLAHNNKWARRWQWQTVVFILLCIFGSILSNPYRDDFIWNLEDKFENVPAYAGIKTSKVKHEAVSWLTAVLDQEQVPKESKVLVIGGHPWIYFASQATPETSMIYMHFTGGEEAAFELLADRIRETADPDYIIIAEEPEKYMGELLNDIIVEKRNAECHVHEIKQQLRTEFKRETSRSFAERFRVCHLK